MLKAGCLKRNMHVWSPDLFPPGGEGGVDGHGGGGGDGRHRPRDDDDQDDSPVTSSIAFERSLLPLANVSHTKNTLRNYFTPFRHSLSTRFTQKS